MLPAPVASSIHRPIRQEMNVFDPPAYRPPLDGDREELAQLGREVRESGLEEVEEHLGAGSEELLERYGIELLRFGRGSWLTNLLNPMEGDYQRDHFLSDETIALALLYASHTVRVKLLRALNPVRLPVVRELLRAFAALSRYRRPPQEPPYWREAEVARRALLRHAVHGHGFFFWSELLGLPAEQLEEISAHPAPWMEVTLRHREVDLDGLLAAEEATGAWDPPPAAAEESAHLQALHDLPPFHLFRLSGQGIIRYWQPVLHALRREDDSVRSTMLPKLQDHFSRTLYTLSLGGMGNDRLDELAQRLRGAVLAEERRKLALLRDAIHSIGHDQEPEKLRLRLAVLLPGEMPVLAGEELARKEEAASPLLPVEGNAALWCRHLLFLGQRIARQGILSLEREEPPLLDRVAHPLARQALEQVMDGEEPFVLERIVAAKAEALLHDLETRLELFSHLCLRLRRHVNPRLVKEELSFFLADTYHRSAEEEEKEWSLPAGQEE